ncbi:YbaK/prolyl-tRNA synthetase associated domain-containing protein [Streptomyces canus]|uniref:YbaK/EbsC family protein n=1 Tax=Streptomyces canus TaxID=58343 RepID=UPI00224E53D6|nr:YbaK/EbsC family protein [Streptomyces canus]MCX4855948.1 YbaK/prolyl-tRNA synthetase associated domain-containing protein [Streptomyces canus]WSW38557.1 YbaK/prolyl-tRNA synthetase associated domain-containing protein [Streptomyces canus]
MPGDDAYDTYDRLISLLDASSVDYTLIDHTPEGTTDAVCALRGHPASEAAKCIVLRVKVDRRTTRNVLAVVPGDRRVDLDAIRALYTARYVGFSDAETAERLARAIPGTVLPFSFDPELEVVADPDVVAGPRLYFNAARLDRSLCLSGADYERLAKPRVEPIAGPVPE